jgi:hypothetical protein
MAGPELQLDPTAAPTRQTPAHSARTAADAPAARRFPLLLLLLLIGLAIAETVALLVQHGAAPVETDWRAAADLLRTERKADEPLLIAPLWSEPLARNYVGDQVDLELWLLSDVDRHARVWELSSRGARHPWLVGLQPARSRAFGALRLALYEKPAPRVLFDFTRQIRRARVERIGDRVTRCAWEHQRFVCDPQQRWNWVGSNLAEVGHRPYRCVYAHAVDGHILRVTFPEVPLGKTIVGYTGIDDFENRKLSKKWVELTVKVGERTLGTIHHENSWPWRRFTLDTSSDAASARAGSRPPGGTAAGAGATDQVRFEVTTEGAFARTFCFAAEMRE